MCAVKSYLDLKLSFINKKILMRFDKKKMISKMFSENIQIVRESTYKQAYLL